MTPQLWIMIAVCLFQALVNVALAVGIFRANRRVAGVESMKATITQQAREVVDRRFDLMAATFEGMVDKVNLVMDGIKERLIKGDELFKEQADNLHAAELAYGKRYANCLSLFATKAELTKWSDQLQTVREELAVVKTQLGMQE